jgi:hypothetical protein
MRWDNGGGARLAELHGLLVRRLMIRRLKKDVMSQLPPKRRQVRDGGGGKSPGRTGGGGLMHKLPLMMQDYTANLVSTARDSWSD